MCLKGELFKHAKLEFQKTKLKGVSTQKIISRNSK